MTYDYIFSLVARFLPLILLTDVKLNVTQQESRHGMLEVSLNTTSVKCWAEIDW